MPEAGVHIETIHPPGQYSPHQLNYAAALASRLDRGKLVIAEHPALRPSADNDDA